MASAEGADLPCGLSQSGVVSVDGLLDDWSGVKGINLSGGAPDDAAGLVRCNYDDATLYLAVAVTDDRLIRTRKAPATDDHVSFKFGGARLDVFPADTEKKVKSAVRWADGKTTKHVAVVDSLLKNGWSVELAIPLGRVPGGGKGAQVIPFELELHDADFASDRRIETVASTGSGAIVMDQASSMFETFLEQNRLKKTELTLDVLSDLDGEPGRERVVAGGKVIAVIGAEYSYIELPVAKPKDVLEVRVVDLGGAGKGSLIARYVERGGGGSREILAIWNMSPDGSFSRMFAHEIAKQLGKNRLTNTWQLVPQAKAKGKGKGKPKTSGKGFDLVIGPGEVVGFTQETWAETPAEDMIPIFLPWGPAKREVWRFGDGEFSGGPE